MNYLSYSQLSWVWMALAVLTFFWLLYREAPYGRHFHDGSARATIDNRLGWFWMELVVMVAFLLFLLRGEGPIPALVWVFAACFLFHYLNRSLIFPFRLRTRGKRMPLHVFFAAISFNVVNGFLLGYWFAHFADYPADWMSGPRFWVGMVMFWGGMAINWDSDNRLIRLRRPGETGYVVPQGGLFRWVSCPNHLGEIIEWTGFAVMTWNLPGLSFAVWTAANLIPRALAHHRWYRERFAEYPAERKALIPFVL